jgi:hypothetical protein
MVHRVWRQLIFCLNNIAEEQVPIKLSFIKVRIRLFFFLYFYFLIY